MEKRIYPGLFFLCILSSLFASFVGFTFSAVFIIEGLDDADNWVSYVFWRALAENTFIVFTIWAIVTGLFAAFFCFVSLGWSAPAEGHNLKIKFFAIRVAVICWLISCAGPLGAATLIYFSEV